MKTSIVVILSSISICNLQAKSVMSVADSLFEILPLQPHLHYIYDYVSNSTIDQLMIVGASTDSGRIEYVVRDSAIVNDSTTMWNVDVRRSILHVVTIKYVPSDSTYTISDTTSHLLMETTKGLHPLAIVTPIWQFPFATPGDTTPVFRFSATSSYTILKEWWTSDVWEHDTLTFVANLGLVLRRTSTLSGISHMTRTFTSTTVRLHGSPVLSVLASNDYSNTFHLAQNYPNPFNPSTTIEYFLPTSSYVTLRLYDLLGRQIRVVDEGMRIAGTHAVVLSADGLTSGVYFYQLGANNELQTRKLLILK
jgi:hypothetical protein